jgi:DNA-binding IclR family transcriptional regulator
MQARSRGGAVAERDEALHSVRSAIDLLKAFAEDEELGVSEVSRRLNVAKSTAHRLLKTLESGGLIEQSAEYGGYRLGVALIELGALVSARQDLRRSSASILEELREATGWTVHLTVAQGADALSLERLTTRRGVQASGELRRRWPLHFTSAGKVLAAFDTRARDARVEAGFPVMTSHTIATVEEFDRELAAIRLLGYARARDELKPNMSSFAAPVFGPNRAIRSAISILGTTESFDRDEARLVMILDAAAKRLSHALQHPGSRGSRAQADGYPG